MILTMPVLIEIARLVDVDLLHLGMIVVLNLVIGLATPPFGICLFIVCGISRVPLEQVALAAQQTQTIRIGTGVAVPGLRLAPVAANGIATINRLASGRTFFGVGTGNTAMRAMGQPPSGVKAFGEYIHVVRALMRGEEVEYTLGRTYLPPQVSASTPRPPERRLRYASRSTTNPYDIVGLRAIDGSDRMR